jgi:sterol desaturase/sphingolipid hydroxylase (fatty acid hydroxylase superfamily)
MLVSWANLEANAYWILFAAALLGIALWEMSSPWRTASPQLARRWRNHASLMAASAAITALIFRAGLVAVAAASANNRFGLLNRPWIPFALRCALALLLLDLLAYALHHVFHSVHLLWKVHQVHHSDHDLDLSTGVRHHPLESIAMQAATAAVIVILAAPPAAVFAVQLLGMLSSFFTHANASLPRWIERPLRMVLVTPEMHRVHHSDEVRDQRANLGEIFPWWDRLFGTYLEIPTVGLDGLQVGLKGFQVPASAGFLSMLTEPFRPGAAEQAPIPDAIASRVTGD